MRRSTVVTACLIVPGAVGCGLVWLHGGDEVRDRDDVAAENLRVVKPDGRASVSEDTGPVPLPDARNAAIAAVAMTDDVFRSGFISRRELIETFATDDFGSTLADQTSQQVTSLLLQLGERDVLPVDVSLVEQPITATVLDESSETASVEVWSVLVVAAEGAGPARQMWRTVTVDLELVEGSWLVDAWTSTLGPTPALSPEADLSGVGEVQAVVAWPQVQKPST